MRTEQIEAEWRRALKALLAAKTLQSERLLEDAVSRAYYAVLHAAKAALLAHETVAETHPGVRRLFGQVLVTAGEIEPQWGRILSRAQDQRAIADYNVDVEIAPPEAEALIAEASQFIDRLEQYLESKGVSLPDEPQRSSAQVDERPQEADDPASIQSEARDNTE